MIQPVIEVTDLTFDYPGFRALERVSLSIAPGTVTALVGPNGAGKTTLLRCIAALDAPVSGTVRVMGLDVFDSPREVHRVMGYLSDNFGLYSELTVAQGLEYAARSQGLPSAAVEVAVQQTAHRLGLSDKLGNLASALSRGQRQRLAIGQAIIHAPKVLLLDEPASGLDPEARSSLAQVFKALQAQGMSLLVSSHILAELDEYSTHMLALNQGRVLEHRALAGPVAGLGAALGAGAMARMLRLEFVQAADAIVPWLQTQADVQLQHAEGCFADITFRGDRSAQAALVAACVAAGHALVSVAGVTENLQQSYLKSLAAQRAAEPPRKMQA